MNIEKNCQNFKLCNVTLETIKKILSCLDTPKASSSGRISSKSLDGAKVLALRLGNLEKLTIKQSLFPDQGKIDLEDYRPVSLLLFVSCV